MLGRILLLTLFLLAPTGFAGAQPTAERTPIEKQEGGLSASRHAVTTAGVNTFMLPFAATTWFMFAADANADDPWRKPGFFFGSAYAAGAAANLGWLVLAGSSLRSYKERSFDWMTLRRARTHVGFTAVDTVFRLTSLVGGIVILGRGDTVGLLLVVPNALLLPFHAWALTATSRELRYRKRETSHAKRRVQPTGSGFRF